jgi:S1-C subfamily serine protease
MNFPNSSNQSSDTLGSGFVYDKQGHIVTNGHVVGDAKVIPRGLPKIHDHSLSSQYFILYYKLWTNT